MQRLRGFFLILGLLVVVLCLPGQSLATGEIVIGQAVGLTGAAAAQKTFFESRVDMIDLINSTGGIKGHMIKHLWVDSKYQLPEEISAYKRFVGQGMVTFLPCSTGASEQLRVIAEQGRVPSLFAVNSTGVRYPPGWHFPIYPTYGDCTAGLFDFITKNMWKKSTPPKVAEITSDTAYGRAPEEAFPYLKSKGIEVVSKAYVAMNAIDLSTQLAQAEQAGADFVLINPLMEIKALLRDMKRLGLDKKGMKVVSPWTAWIASIFPGVAAEEGSGFLIGTFQAMIPDFEGQKGLPIIDQSFKDLQKKKYNGSLYPPGMYWMFGPPELAIIKKAAENIIAKVGYDKLTGEEMYKQFEAIEVKSNEMYNVMPDIKSVPGKRGMSSKAIIAMAKEGKWEAQTGWFDMPNLLEWKDKHPEYYK